MRYFFDTEFWDKPTGIELISIAIVPQYGNYNFYAINSDFDWNACTSDWLKENVLPKLGDPRTWIPKSEIKERVEAYLLPYVSSTPDMWAYNAATDWVVFYNLWGTLMDIPEGMPNHVRDVKQLRDMFGIVKEDLPKRDGGEHNALDDALWLRDAHAYIVQRAVERLASGVDLPALVL